MAPTALTVLTERRRQMLEAIIAFQDKHGYAPTVREICAQTGLRSPASVKAHLDVLKEAGYLSIDARLPRAMRVCYDEHSGARVERRRARHVPLVGEVAAGAGVLAEQNVQELVPIPDGFAPAGGDLFMLQVRGDSMSGAGILHGDFVVCRAQQTADDGDIVVAGVFDGEATIKTLRHRGEDVVLEPSNDSYEPLVLPASDVAVYGVAVTVLRRL